MNVFDFLIYVTVKSLSTSIRQNSLVGISVNDMIRSWILF